MKPFIDEQIIRCGHKLVIFGVLLVLTATLFPYDFSLVSVEGPSDSSGFFVHVLLFLPLGFGFTCLTHQRGLGSLAELLVIIAAGSAVAFATEGLQVFLPRSHSLTDALANILGTLLGFVIFRLWKFQILNCTLTFLERIRRFFTSKVLIGSFLAYATVMFLISIPFQQATRLTNWDSAFPLLLGNERTADRPWKGTVYQLQVANRAVAEGDVVEAFSEKGLFTSSDGLLLASYDFTGGGPYSDKSGQLPELVWKGDSPHSWQGRGAFLGAGHWLETSAPAAWLTQEIRKTSQFTLSTTVATGDPMQDGDTRIISLSEDPYHRNFTLGQKRNDLFVRLRTHLTGENGTNPQLNVPNVFLDTKPHHLIITYDGAAIRLFVDGVQHSRSLALTPEASLFGYLFPLNADHMIGYKALYYGLMFVPIGLLLALMVKNSKRHFAIQAFLIALGSLLPSLVLEGILVSVSTRSPEIENLLLGMVISSVTLWLFDFIEQV